MKRYIYSLIALALAGLTSCSWLDIEPEGDATDKKLFATGDGYRTVLAGVYKAMGDASLYGRELQFGLVDCISQQYTWRWNYSLNNTKNTYRDAAQYNYQALEVTRLIDGVWDKGYNVIANCNNLIKNLENAPIGIFAHGEMERDMILGEAYACRALMHFDLYRLFAPAPIENDASVQMPYVKEYPIIQPMSIDLRSYQEALLADLEEALKYTARFDTTALGQSMSVSARARYRNELSYGMEGYQKEATVDDFFKFRGYRMSYYATQALLARVHQYLGNHDKAAEYAQLVLDTQFKAKTSADTYNIFDINNEDFSVLSREVEQRTDLKMPSTLIFAVYNRRGFEEYDIASFFMKESRDYNDVGNWLVLDLERRPIFKNRDSGADEQQDDARARFLLFQPNHRAFENRPYMISAKFYPSNNEEIRRRNMEASPVLRTSELRYILAESKARRGAFAEAYTILNEMRMKRGLYEPLKEKVTLDAFMADMVQDAEREWISEGQLFYLYKRLRYPITIGNEANPRPMNKSEYMLPIPVNQQM